MIAQTPAPPYYAVIFTSLRADETADDGYAEMGTLMMKLAAEQPGFLGVESARDGLGITVSYWESEEAIRSWRENAEHRLAQQLGYRKWYASFKTRVCKVERDYGKQA